MANMFEKTMNACLESRRVETKNKKTLKEADELIDQELGLFDDDVDEIINDELPVDPDLDPESDVQMGDFADDVVVVIDPEVAPDTEPGDMPPVEEYVGDLTYRCPICGNSFFSETEMAEGEECPVCAEIPGEGFELVGEIAATDDVAEDEKADDEKKDEEPKDDEKEEVIDVEELEVDETEKEESVNRRPARRPAPRREARSTPPARRPVRRPVAERRTPSRRPVRRPVAEQRTTPVRRPVKKMEDISFSKYLTRFVRENYKNARSLRLVGATKNNNKLTLECRLVMKSGKARNIKLTCEGYRSQGNFVLRATDDGILKRESKSAPMTFKCSVRNGAIVCEGMRYDYITRISESKKAHVRGQYMNESVRPVRNRRPAPRKAVESRNVARRPMPRRTAMESRRPVRRPAQRPMPRRVAESRRPVRKPAPRRAR